MNKAFKSQIPDEFLDGYGVRATYQGEAFYCHDYCATVANFYGVMTKLLAKNPDAIAAGVAIAYYRIHEE